MQTPDQVGAPDPTVSLPLLEVLVSADLARAPHVAAVNGLPELLGELCSAASLEGRIPPVIRQAPGRAVAVDQVHDDQLEQVLVDATLLGRVYCCVNWRESLLGSPKVLAPDGSGDNGNGWGPGQRDKNDPEGGAADVALIRQQSPFSAPWWRVSTQLCLAVFLRKLRLYPTQLEAAVCCYNARKARVDQGLAEANDPNRYTTGKDYGRDVLNHVLEWWPA